MPIPCPIPPKIKATSPSVFQQPPVLSGMRGLPGSHSASLVPPYSSHCFRARPQIEATASCHTHPAASARRRSSRSQVRPPSATSWPPPRQRLGRQSSSPPACDSTSASCQRLLARLWLPARLRLAARQLRSASSHALQYKYAGGVSVCQRQSACVLCDSQHRPHPQRPAALAPAKPRIGAEKRPHPPFQYRKVRYAPPTTYQLLCCLHPLLRYQVSVLR